MKFYIKDHGETAEDAREIPKPYNNPWWNGAEDFAEAAADYCFHQGNGWEWDWPKTITVVEDDGKEVDVEVEIEEVPHFNGRRVKT